MALVLYKMKRLAEDAPASGRAQRCHRCAEPFVQRGVKPIMDA